jgi:hypothetical protein
MVSNKAWPLSASLNPRLSALPTCGKAFLVLLRYSCWSVWLSRGFAQNHENKLLLGRDRLLPYSVGDGRWGYIDDSGKVIVPATFGSATFFYGGFGIVGFMDGKCGYIDTNGKLAIPVQFSFCETFSEGIATVQFHNHVGTDMKLYSINEQGKLVFPTELGYVGEFIENIAPARKDAEKCAYIDTSANWVKGSRSVLEELLLPAVEHRRFQAQVFTQVRNWHLVQKVTPQNRNLLFSSPLDEASTSETTIAVTTPVNKRYRAF